MSVPEDLRCVVQLRIENEFEGRRFVRSASLIPSEVLTQAKVCTIRSFLRPLLPCLHISHLYSSNFPSSYEHVCSEAASAILTSPLPTVCLHRGLVPRLVLGAGLSRYTLIMPTNASLYSLDSLDVLIPRPLILLLETPRSLANSQGERSEKLRLCSALLSHARRYVLRMWHCSHSTD